MYIGDKIVNAIYIGNRGATAMYIGQQGSLLNASPIVTNYRNQGLSSAEIDAILIDLATKDLSDETIDIRGNFPRTSASDSAVNTLTVTQDNILREDVNIMTLSSSDIDEGLAIGSVVGALSMSNDDYYTYTYSLVSGYGDNASFAVDGSNLESGEEFDYDTKNSYDIKVRATNDYFYIEKVFTISINEAVDAAFRMTVDTTKPGSASDTFILSLFHDYVTPLINYDFDINWGDGVVETYAGTGYSLGDITHVYASAGEYQIAITENVPGGFPRIYFNDTDDKLKVISLDNWGSIVWGSSMEKAFFGCANMLPNYADRPNFSNVETFRASFRDCALFNGNLSGIDSSSATDFYGMLWNASGYKQSLEYVDIRNSPNLTYLALSCDINEAGTTDNYDATLISLRDQAETYDITGLNPHFGTSQYSAAAQTARDYLVNTKGWTITDGGLAT